MLARRILQAMISNQALVVLCSPFSGSWLGILWLDSGGMFGPRTSGGSSSVAIVVGIHVLAVLDTGATNTPSAVY
jgi:hypothetical protein